MEIGDRALGVWLAGLDSEVFRMVERSPLGNVLGREAMYFNLELAVAKYLAFSKTESRVTSRGD
jgi:SulP family sulfate permease